MNKSISLRAFTIVELLIAVVVIAILAAIVTVSYNGITNQANDTAVKSDMANIKKRIEMHMVKSGSSEYPNSAYGATPFSGVAGITFSKNSYLANRNNGYYCWSVDNTDYSLGFVSKSGKGFLTTSKSEIREVAGSQISGQSTYDELNSPGVLRCNTSYVYDSANNVGNWNSWIK